MVAGKTADGGLADHGTPGWEESNRLGREALAGPIVLTDDAQPYLVAQQGALDSLRNEPITWAQQYQERIAALYRCIEYWLPKRCAEVLDVGGGMGGIDVLLSRRYGLSCRITIMDGVNDPPYVELHRRTFSNRDIAIAFLAANGVRRVGYIDAAGANELPATALQSFDLVLSIASWCFHYPPREYLAFVKASCRPGTRLIIDVRRDQPEWLNELSTAFLRDYCVHEGLKFRTFAFSARA